MPDVDVLDTTNGHHEEPEDSSPLDDTLPPLGVSTSDAAGESTDEADPPAEHVEEDTKDEPPAQKAQKVPSKPTPSKPPATVVKKARVIVLFAICPEISSRLHPFTSARDGYLFCWASRLSVLALRNLLCPRSPAQASNPPPPLHPLKGPHPLLRGQRCHLPSLPSLPTPAGPPSSHQRSSLQPKRNGYLYPLLPNRPFHHPFRSRRVLQMRNRRRGLRWSLRLITPTPSNLPLGFGLLSQRLPRGPWPLRNCPVCQSLPPTRQPHGHHVRLVWGPCHR